MNPFAWVKEKLGAGLREKPTQKEQEAGKLQAQREGTGNVFEAVPVPTKKALKRATTPLKPKPTSVRLLRFLFE
jgi:large subunit ribosomal protein L22